MRSNNTRHILLVALFTALIIVGTFIRVPLPPVPITLQTFFVMLAALLLSPSMALASVVLYMFLGAIGIPVFSSGGGIGALLGPTGGFILGWIPAALLGSFVAGKGKNPVRLILALVVVQVFTYGVGVPWLKFKLGLTWAKAYAAGMGPFMIGDAVKMAAAFLVALSPLKDRIQGGEERS